VLPLLKVAVIEVAALLILLELGNRKGVGILDSSTHDQLIERNAEIGITGYVPAAAVVGRGLRQEARYKLRSSLRLVTKLKNLRYCGLPFEGNMVVRCKDGVHHFSGMHRLKDDPHHFTGLSTCGSPWVCPVCAGKIRAHRAEEASRAIVSALEKGYSILSVTDTIPHSAEHELGVTLNMLAEGRRFVANQTVVKSLRREVGFVGSITGKEITHGLSGWHPHSHSVEIFEHEMTLASYAGLSSAYYDYFNRFYRRNGFDGLSRQHGIRVEPVELGGVALANYVAKFQEGAAIRLHTAHEVARWDLKLGRSGSMMPFDIAAQYFRTGDWAMLQLWYEFEEYSRRKSAIRFTKDLRALLLPHEADQSDKQLAELKVGGTNVVLFTGSFYRKIAKVPELECKVLNALDAGGFAALVKLLEQHQLDDPDGYWQLAGNTEDDADQSMIED
jgi:hypothetical protein